jgi:hypothetical protein
LPEGGALIVYEPMIDDERRNKAFGLLMSLNVQVALAGGFSATGTDMRAWLRYAGFRETSLRHLVGTGSSAVPSMVVAPSETPHHFAHARRKLRRSVNAADDQQASWSEPRSRATSRPVRTAERAAGHLMFLDG